MNEDTTIYYVDRPHFQEAMLTFAFRGKVNWLEEGLSIASWTYTKVANLDNVKLSEVFQQFRSWNGNAQSKRAGHRVISVGDVVVVGDNAWMTLGRGWALIPGILWGKVRKN